VDPIQETSSQTRHEELKKFRLGRGAGMARIASERAAAVAPIIAEIRAAGATSLRAIVAELTKRGIPTARGTGSWSASQVASVMSRHEELKKFRLAFGAGSARIASERAAAIAPIIVEIRAAGATSLRAVVAELIRRGIPTARGTGSWSATQVARIILRQEGRRSRRQRKSSHRVWRADHAVAKCRSWPIETDIALQPNVRCWVDSVAKVVLHWWSKILRAADAIFV
jgi:homoserine kinase